MAAPKPCSSMSDTTPRLSAGLDSTPAMEAIFSDRTRVQRMLDVEAALALVEARHGVIPVTAAVPIGAACQAGLIDFAALSEAAASAGNLDIPLVRQLTACVKEADAEAAKYVHWGATSQDVIDTGMALQLRDALAQIDADLRQLGAVLSELADKHRATPQVGRTWMQHALPITFGIKVAGWLDALTRHIERLGHTRAHSAMLQMGGAAGTLASLGDKGLQVAQSLAGELKLGLPIMPWHGARDRFAEAATTLGLLTGTLGKMARDIALLSQTEIAELAEPSAPGRGGSSAMPHKRNPVSCAATLAAAERVPHLVATMLGAMNQENERALGGWQAEWETLPQIVRLAACALQQMLYVCSGLHVDAERMRHNLDLTQGQVMAEAVTTALAAKIGRQAAFDVVERACRAAASASSSAPARHLRAVLEQDGVIGAHLSTKELDHAFDPTAYTGEAVQFVDRAIAAWRAQMQQEH